MKKKLLAIIVLLNLAFLGFQAMPAQAQTVGPLLDQGLINEVSCQNPDGSPKKECNYSLNSFVRLGISASRIILGVVGALTLLMFIYGGFRMLISGGNTEAVAEGKKIITGAVVGLAIVFSSYLIVSFVVNNIFKAQVNGNPAFTGTAPDDPIGTGSNSIKTNDCSAPGPVGKSGTCVAQTECPPSKGSIPGKTTECGNDKVCCVPTRTCTQAGFRCVAGSSCGGGSQQISGRPCPNAGEICCSGAVQTTCQMMGNPYSCHAGSTCPFGTQAAPSYPCSSGQVCCVPTNINVSE